MPAGPALPLAFKQEFIGGFDLHFGHKRQINLTLAESFYLLTRYHFDQIDIECYFLEAEACQACLTLQIPNTVVWVSETSNSGLSIHQKCRMQRVQICSDLHASPNKRKQSF